MKVQYFKFGDSITMEVRTNNPFLANIFAVYYASHAIKTPQTPQIIIDTTQRPLPEFESIKIDTSYYATPSSLYFKRHYKFANWVAGFTWNENGPIVVKISGDIPSYYVYPFQTVVTALKIAMLRHGWISMHALGVKSTNGTATIISGRSAIGKTILGVLAKKRGSLVLSDDTIFLDSEGMVCGLRQPVGLRFTYNVKKTLGLNFSIFDRIIRLRNFLLKWITFGSVNFFLAIPFDRIFGSNDIKPLPLSKIFLTTQGTKTTFSSIDDMDPLKVLNAIYLLENIELEQLLLVHSTAYPGGFGSKLYSRSKEILNQALSRASIYNAEVQSVITIENSSQLLMAICENRESE